MDGWAVVAPEVSCDCDFLDELGEAVVVAVVVEVARVEAVAVAVENRELAEEPVELLRIRARLELG